MGQKQSKHKETTTQSQLEARLRALEFTQTSTDNEYVMVDEKVFHLYNSMSRDVSITTAEQWQQELLSVPKNR